jgi:5-(carboxyamino)imidazole ribonucleotide mutase
MPKVLILIGSQSDMAYAERCEKMLDEFGIEHELVVSSAHRQPDRTDKLAQTAESRGFEVIICMAGLAAALPGVVAARTDLPVIGVPLPAALGGMDSLLAIAQMPGGVPVATMGIGNAGAKNAAVLAAKILALKHSDIKKRLKKSEGN